MMKQLNVYAKIKLEINVGNNILYASTLLSNVNCISVLITTVDCVPYLLFFHIYNSFGGYAIDFSSDIAKTQREQ